MKRKLKQTLDNLIAEYGAECVQETLFKCEPFASEMKRRLRETHEMFQSQHNREYLRVRSRTTLLKYLDTNVSINTDEERQFIVWTHAKTEDGRKIEYRESKEQLSDFIEWLRNQGYGEDDYVGSLPGIVLRFTHKERERLERMEREEIEANKPQWEKDFDRELLSRMWSS